MNLTRRGALRGGTASLVAIAAGGAVAAAVPAIAKSATSRDLLATVADDPPLDPEALEVARLFMLIESDSGRASLHQATRWGAGLQSDPTLSARIPPASAYYTRDIAILDRGEAS